MPQRIDQEEIAGLEKHDIDIGSFDTIAPSVKSVSRVPMSAIIIVDTTRQRMLSQHDIRRLEREMASRVSRIQKNAYLGSADKF